MPPKKSRDRDSSEMHPKKKGRPDGDAGESAAEAVDELEISNKEHLMSQIIHKLNHGPLSKHPDFHKEKIIPLVNHFQDLKMKGTVGAVIGKTGFGKSRFINKLLGENAFPTRPLNIMGSCTMLPTWIKYGETFSTDYINVNGDFTETMNKHNTFATVVELHKYLFEENEILEAKYLANAHYNPNENPFVIVTLPSKFMKDNRFELIDFPGETEEVFGPMLIKQCKWFLLYLQTIGVSIGVVFAGCVRHVQNPFLALHVTVDMISNYGFFQREILRDSKVPLFCLLDNFYMGEPEKVKMVQQKINSSEFLNLLIDEFVSCVDVNSKRSLRSTSNDELLKDSVGITHFPETYFGVFNREYIDQYWTMYRKSCQTLIPEIRKFIDHIDIHLNFGWESRVRHVIAKAISKQADTLFVRLFTDISALLKHKRPFRRNGATSVSTILPKELNTIPQITSAFKEFYREVTEIDWEEPGRSMWSIFVTGLVESFLYSDIPGSVYKRIWNKFAEYSPDYVVEFGELLYEKLEPLRLQLASKFSSPDSILPASIRFTGDLQAALKSDNDLTGGQFASIVSIMRETFNIQAQIPEIYRMARSIFEDMEKKQGIEVIRILHSMKKESQGHLKRIRQSLISSVFEVDSCSNESIANELNFKRFQPCINKGYQYCPRRLIDKNLQFQSNDEVDSRYKCLQAPETRVTIAKSNKFFKSKIFCNNSYPDAFQSANLSFVQMKTSNELTVEQRQVNGIQIKVINCCIDNGEQKCLIADFDKSNIRTPVLIPSYLVQNEDGNIRDVHYFLEEIYDNDAALDGHQVGPFFVVIEKQHLSIFLNELGRQISEISPKMSAMQSALKKYFSVVCVANEHIGVGRARDLCRLLAIHMDSRQFFIIHDDICTITKYNTPSAYQQNPPSYMPLKALQSMIDLLEFERLDFSGIINDEETIENTAEEVCKRHDILGLTNRSKILACIQGIITEPSRIRNAENFSAYLNNCIPDLEKKYPQLAFTIKSAVESLTNNSICQVALLSTCRDKNVLRGAEERRRKGYTHGLSTTLYECTLYSTDPCKNVSFLAPKDFFAANLEDNYQNHLAALRRYGDDLPIQGWNSENFDLDGAFKDAVMKEIQGGYRYEDHAFHERLMLRGYVGAVLYDYIIIPYLGPSAVEDHLSVMGDHSIFDDDELDNSNDMDAK